jgi:hypothetical protein
MDVNEVLTRTPARGTAIATLDIENGMEPGMGVTLEVVI